MRSSSTDSSPTEHSTAIPSLSDVRQTRRPTIAQAKWFALSYAERIQRYSSDDTILSAHPALSSVRDTVPEQLHASLDTVLASRVESLAVHYPESAQQDASLEGGSAAPPPADRSMAPKQQEAALSEQTACTSNQKDDPPESSNTDPVPSAPQTYRPRRQSAHSSWSDQEPDYAARAANVRRALDKHIRQEGLLRRRSILQSRRSSSSSRQSDSQSGRSLAEQRKSVGSLVSLGKTMTRSLSLSQMLPRVNERVAAGKENLLQRSPQKARIGNLRRKPVPVRSRSVFRAGKVVEMPAVSSQPGLESMVRAGNEQEAHEQDTPDDTEQPLHRDREVLGLVSSSHQLTHDMLRRSKEKAANIRAKVKKTMEVWRSDGA
ncbi:hypothetical protein AMS68_000475 [Peltaster fructicola]|uniref:Uncharacterized protein n=1 Tax=Peltaster fructicola TaxID=286661 RepID=A0A6H0XJZ9_9PEZI|nr:hypothetical protein AMS68_000475 [Peltaster fructicola]